MKKEYYFKFVVSDSIAHEFDNYDRAVKKAKRLNEKIYLCIYSYKNRCNEVYDEVVIESETDIEEVKKKLIKSFKTLTEY